MTDDDGFARGGSASGGSGRTYISDDDMTPVPTALIEALRDWLGRPGGYVRSTDEPVKSIIVLYRSGWLTVTDDDGFIIQPPKETHG